MPSAKNSRSINKPFQQCRLSWDGTIVLYVCDRKRKKIYANSIKICKIIDICRGCYYNKQQGIDIFCLGGETVLKRRMQKRKCGFTLVELVVVIAILAILAAIAIPVVVGIIDNANKTSDMTDAKELDEACMTYKTGIVWGVINSSDFGHSTQSNLPPPNSSLTTKIAAAKAATVKDAIHYSNITKMESKVSNGSFVYDSEGKIYAQIDRTDLSDVLTLTTTFNDLYY